MKEKAIKKKTERIVVILGPTTVGKSALAVRLARRFRGEIISADSRQVYRGLDIGTGKMTKRERRGVPNHLLDVASPAQQFSVAKFQELARKKIKEIAARGKLPIVAGGSGLYINAILGILTLPAVHPNPTLRAKLARKSTEELFALLARMDPRRARRIDPKNPRRLIRAIEIAEELGSVPPLRYSISPKFRPIWIGLTLPPETLKKKIVIRLFARMGEGMEREVRRLHEKGLSWRRMEALGLEYRYVSRYLRGLLTKEAMIERLQTEIWRYAKRQMTWFRRNARIKWFRPNEHAAITEEAARFLNDKNL
ncbi:MAG: tRNA dimethylallyltransferase [Parcubacteria group bacterium Greene0416_79]|nr:MAG: tRNA dimethylallyltransferase [Parcubacteria group bacterium Greene0416_79]